MARVDLKLGYACNNRCVFCVQGERRSRSRSRSAERIRADLLEGRRHGVEALVLTGGEPALQPGFVETIRLASRLGYRRIRVETNARLFAYESLCRQSIEAGATEFATALHAPSAELHQALTRAPGSFEQTMNGIRNLLRLGQRVTANAVITEENYRQLPELARLFVSLGVRRFQLAFVHLVGAAHQNRQRLAPRISAAMPFVHEALEIGRSAGVHATTEAIPRCLMRGREQFATEQIDPRTRLPDADTVIESHSAHRGAEGKAKSPSCVGCRWDDRCDGPWREYPELFGWEEFEPVSDPVGDPVGDRSGEPFRDIELISVLAGIKPALRLTTAREETRRVQERLQEAGLVTFAIDGALAKAGERLDIVCAAPDRKLANRIIGLERKLNRTISLADREARARLAGEIGKLLGYPECCIEAHLGRIRTIEPEDAESYVAACQAWAPRPDARLNDLVAGAGAMLISFEPCSYTCARALAYADKVMATMEQAHPGAVERIMAVLRRPVVVHSSGARVWVEPRAADDRSIAAVEPVPRAWGRPERDEHRGLAESLVGKRADGDGEVPVPSGTARLFAFC